MKPDQLVERNSYFFFPSRRAVTCHFHLFGQYFKDHQENCHLSHRCRGNTSSKQAQTGLRIPSRLGPKFHTCMHSSLIGETSTPQGRNYKTQPKPWSCRRHAGDYAEMMLQPPLGLESSGQAFRARRELVGSLTIVSRSYPCCRSLMPYF